MMKQAWKKLEPWAAYADVVLASVASILVAAIVVTDKLSEHAAIGATRSSADRQAEDVRPVVVAGRVEALPLLVQPRRLEVGVEDSFPVVERPCEIRAVGAEDRAAAAADHVRVAELRPERKVVRVG